MNKPNRKKLNSLKRSAMNHTKDTAFHMDKKIHRSPWISLGVTLASALVIGLFLGRKD